METMALHEHHLEETCDILIVRKFVQVNRRFLKKKLQISIGGTSVEDQGRFLKTISKEIFIGKMYFS